MPFPRCSRVPLTWWLLVGNLNRSELEEDVNEVICDLGLEDSAEELKRGAYLAKDPHLYEQVARGNASDEDLPLRLKPREKAALIGEKDHLFRQSRDLCILFITCATAGIVQGWDQASLNTSLLYFDKDNDLFDGQQPSDWIIGILTAAPWVSAAFVGCLLADPINAWLGRRGTIFFAGVWCFASTLASAYTHTWHELLICRLCLGIGFGAKGATVAVYSAECAPTYFRGSIVMCWQLWVATGLWLGFTASLIVCRAGPLTWRLLVAGAFVPTLPLLILAYIPPESPRWHMKKDDLKHYRKALDSLKCLRNTNLQACRDFYFMHKQLQHERAYFPQLQTVKRDVEKGSLKIVYSHLPNYFVRLGQLFWMPRIRRATLATCIVMLSQQLCGINIMAFYSSTTFSNAQPGQQQQTAMLYSWGFGMVNAVFTLGAVRTIDVYGRRCLLLLSLFGMFCFLLPAALFFLIPSDNTNRIVPVVIFSYLFTAAYSPGMGPVPFTYSAEAFPLSHREIGMGVAVATNFFFTAVLTIFYPHIVASFNDAQSGDARALAIFAGFNLVAFILVFLWVPETAERTLEEISQVFGMTSREHIKYQFQKVLPWVWRRYVRRQGEPRIPPCGESGVKAGDSPERPEGDNTTGEGRSGESSPAGGRYHPTNAERDDEDDPYA